MPEPLRPEVLPPGPDPAALRSARLVARLLDEAVEIPGTGWRIGLDPIVGLVPGIGDVVGALLSGWIVLVGVRLGAPGPVIARMALNVALDTIVGAIPFGGDLFDFAWKANARNVRLLEGWLDRPGQTHRASGALVAGVVVALLLVLAAVVFALWRLLAWAAGAVTA
jgi:hypothetical protein